MKKVKNVTTILTVLVIVVLVSVVMGSKLVRTSSVTDNCATFDVSYSGFTQNNDSLTVYVKINTSVPNYRIVRQLEAATDEEFENRLTLESCIPNGNLLEYNFITSEIIDELYVKAPVFWYSGSVNTITATIPTLSNTKFENREYKSTSDFETTKLNNEDWFKVTYIGKSVSVANEEKNGIRGSKALALSPTTEALVISVEASDIRNIIPNSPQLIVSGVTYPGILDLGADRDGNFVDAHFIFELPVDTDLDDASLVIGETTVNAFNGSNSITKLLK